MLHSEGQKLFHVIPPQESKCVWMTAGVLSYQLCDREFECEQCPLDIALRQRFTHHEPSLVRESTATQSKGVAGSQVGVLFGRKHLWIEREDESKVRVGIEPGMISVLLSPMAVVLPAQGAQIARDKACSWIVLSGGTLPLISPITGRVTATNSRIAEHPHAVCASPLGDGWLFELSVTSLDFAEADVLPMADVARIYAEDERPLRELISTEMRDLESREAQMSHGSTIERVSEKLGPTEYLKLLRAIYT